MEHFLIMIQALVEPLLEKAKELKVKVNGIGLGIAGVMDQERKTMVVSPNISNINEAKIAEQLQEKIGLSVVMDNDCKCFVRAEALLGAGQKYKNIYAIIIGTGIGGAWWHNNEVDHGAHGNAGEPGVMIINFAEEIELEKAYHQLLQNNPEQMAEEAFRGDILAQKAFAEIGKYLGLAFANIINIVDPEVIIIGGGVVQAADLFLPMAKKYMPLHVQSKAAQKTKILTGKLGQHAGAIGAALLIQ
ncbi:MAG: ROK family protein [Candidatus Falkowbacteria bacterium]|nr:ROK family protein [Candidatus Falkowbacteria bacterium]